jgi:two-component system KDP operon response regulator KdpE
MREVVFGEIAGASGLVGQRVAPKSAALPENPPHLSVLVVDDEPLIRWSLRTGLTRRGHEVVEAKSAGDAIHAIGTDSDRFHVVVLDYRLPDRQDLSLLADVRRLLPRAVVLMMTAFGDADMRAGALALGARAVVDKPFQVGQLISLIEAPAVN